VGTPGVNRIAAVSHDSVSLRLVGYQAARRADQTLIVVYGPPGRSGGGKRTRPLYASRGGKHLYFQFWLERRKSTSI
jgi:hypothetical protein